MEGISGGCAEDAGGEVGRLQEELRKAEERMRLWKERTQIAVNELRDRIVKLTSERNELQEALTELKNHQEQKRQQDADGGSKYAADGASSSSPSSSLVYVPDATILRGIMQWTIATLDAFFPILLQKSEFALGLAACTSQELDKCKRRTAQTLRLQAKNMEALQSEISGLQQQLNEALAEVRERNHAIDSRDQALSVLQNRLEDLEAANLRLESSRALLSNKPNAEQINMFEERLEEELENVRREFVSRENVIFDQHRDEIERLLAKHEEEVAELRAELEEKILAAETAMDATAAAKVDANLADRSSEGAYMDLKRDFEALQDELKATQGENETLMAELREVRGKLAHFNGNCTTNENSLVASQKEPFTLPEALVRIAELESGMMRLSEELCETKKRLIAVKHQANAKDVSRSHVLEGQQLSYLKCIVVKLLGARECGNVGRNLLPVLSTLLKFNSEDLQELYAAHPDWVKRKF
ncbi:hypothetical protein MOQ_002468 [Trypanosoma cruzi marinkellei]|uniref:GRIP domain-containing protein n=1 Tax=Trypanosoma cruzi marinkellei TaxID=85056 RepID=K2NXU0_TRYCR|nr:hypothetical protein MOQ_002468 [Trypanosoma cruzi marinkellei]